MGQEWKSKRHKQSDVARLPESKREALQSFAIKNDKKMDC